MYLPLSTTDCLQAGISLGRSSTRRRAGERLQLGEDVGGVVEDTEFWVGVDACAIPMGCVLAVCECTKTY